MKKHHNSRPSAYRAVPANDALRFRGSIVTILCNLATLIVYGTALKLSLDGTLALIVFSILTILQFVICAVIGVNYNSKMWLISALVIFLIGCGVVLYSSM